VVDGEEGGLANGPESDLPPFHLDLTDDFVALDWRVGVAADRQGHEVDDLADPIVRQEARDEDVGVGPVELLPRVGPPSGMIWNRPPRTGSRMAAKTGGESNSG
jgi:hypothetical protein